jgi:serine protease Do
MKKVMIVAGMLALFTAPAMLQAQTGKKEKAEKAEKKEKMEKVEKVEKVEKIELTEKEEAPARRETKEITIRQNGDKEVNLKVEIKGDDITVNGKPLAEYKDKDVIINKRKITVTDGKKSMTWNMGPGQEFGEDFMRHFELEKEAMAKPGAFLGVTSEDTDKDAGAKITEVVKGSAAEKAGLKKDDIITKVGDTKITNPENLSDVVSAQKPNEEVTIGYKRNGKDNTTKATLGQRKVSPRIYSFRGPEAAPGEDFMIPRISPDINLEGLEDMQINGSFDFPGHAFFPRQKKVGLKLQDTEDANGVKVINVEDSSAAAMAGIKKDDLIIQINDHKIATTDDAREELVPDEDKRAYKIKALRNGTEMIFDVKIPRKLKTADF